jgi:putative spermidine/putrescine transport system ATP-binding protein
MTSDGISVSLTDCARTFPDGTRALQGCSLEISPGETIALLGPSGCGKTTLLRIIAGLDFPDAGGRVSFGGADVTSKPVEQRGVGMVFQSYALFPNMDVAGNIEYGLRVRRVARVEREQRVTEMLALMRIDELRHRRVDQLSGGQRQRVALARAIAARPRLLLLDEPLTALDARLRDDLRVEIDQLLRTLGITAIYVTHDQAEAMALADRIAVMSRGRIEQIGTPREIYETPKTPFVTEFIGTMNRVSGQVLHGVLSLGTENIPVSAPDGQACLLFRPEDLKLVAAHEAQFSATVASAFYFGDHIRLTLALANGQVLTAKVSPHEAVAVGHRVGCSIVANRHKASVALPTLT